MLWIIDEVIEGSKSLSVGSSNQFVMLSKVESLVRGVGLGNFILNVLYDVEKYLVTVSYSEQGTRGL